MVTSPLMTKELRFPYETNETNERENSLSLSISLTLSLSHTHTSIFFYDRLWIILFLLKLKKMLSNIIKSNDFKTCQPEFLSSLSFEVNYMETNPKSIIQFNKFKNNLNK